MVDAIKNLDLRSNKSEDVIDVSRVDMTAYGGQTQSSSYQGSIWDGGKFAGGFGATQLFAPDYWTLRARSEQLFTENLYAAGLIARLITNEIGPGLMPEAAPDELILGLKEDSLNDWTEEIETRFGIYSKSPQVVDWKKENTWGAIMRAARQAAYIGGDCLVVLRYSARLRMPAIQLISGKSVQTPFFSEDPKLAKGHTIKHGVELDAVKRVVAHWVRQDDGTTKRIPAYGPKTGRKISWLVFGLDKRFEDVRGMPLLGVVMQSLKEVDRYRDSVQRKATINSILAMVVTKKDDKMGTLPMQGGAQRRGTVTTTNTDGTPRSFNIGSYLPGTVIDELQTGEDVKLKGGEGTDINFGEFEAAIIHAVAWCREVPPEILTLAFSNNYSASQAAINEFKIYINKVWTSWGETYCTPIYIEWLVSEILLQKIKAPGLLEAWRDLSQYDIFGAWVQVDWYGSIKPSTDMLKQAKGSKMLVDEGWSTNAREARITTGTKFSKNIKRLRQENKLKVEAMRPLLELEKEFGEEETDIATAELGENILSLIDMMEEAS